MIDSILLILCTKSGSMGNVAQGGEMRSKLGTFCREQYNPVRLGIELDELERLIKYFFITLA